MALNVGDAVLTFLGDTTPLDQAFARIPAQAEAAMGAAAASVGQVGTAVQGINFELDATASNVPYAGEQISSAMEKGAGSTRMAAGEVSLLGELFGIHLPRHVRTFVGELPGVSTALQSAFAATAVLFLIEALVKGVEKVMELANAGKEIEEAWAAVDKAQQGLFNHLEDNLLKAESRTAELTGNHLEALRLKLQAINNQSLEQLDKELEKLGQEADAAFAKMDRSWFTKLLTGFEGAEDAKNTLKEVGSEVDKALSTRTPEAFDNALAKVNSALAESDAKVKKLTDEQNALQATMAEAGDPLMKDQGVDPRTIESWQKLSTVLQGYKADIEEAHKAEQEEAKDAGIQERNRQATEAVSQAKLALDAQIANIEKWKSEQQIAFAAGKIDAAAWAVAQVQATDSAAIAHETYLQKVVAIYKSAGDAQKAQTAQQELATFQTKSAAKETELLAGAMEKHHSATQEVVEEYAKLVNLGIEKDFAATAKATQDLAKAQETLLKTQTELDLENSAKRYHDQEEAIKQLASMQLITEQQKNAKLIQLYNQQESAALKILQDQLAKEKAIVDAAQAKVKSAEGNAFFTDAQVLELKKNLALAEVAYLKTQDQISKTDDKFEKERLALQKGAIGQAITLATAAGNQQLALDLKQHQAALVAIKDQIDLAKARGQDVAAMKAQQKEIQNSTNALVKEATQVTHLRQIWDAFSVDFAKTSKQDESTAQQLGQSFSAFAKTVEAGIGASVAATVSGSDAFGAAMEKMLKSALASLAGEAAVHVIRELAGAASDLATIGMEWHASLHFKAAAEWAAVGALAGIGGALIPGGSSSGGGASANSAPITQNTSTGTSAQPVTVANIPKLGGGGLVSRQTLAIVGDAPGGGNQKEAVIPLGDSEAMRQISQAFGLAGVSGGGDTHHNYYINGMVSTSDLTKLTRMITRGSNTGRVRMTVANSSRVTRRS